jgi:hypothetical protein
MQGGAGPDGSDAAGAGAQMRAIADAPETARRSRLTMR